MARALLTLLMVVALGASLAACGRKGPLEPRPGAPAQGPVTEEGVPVEKPDRSFILDGLLS